MPRDLLQNSIEMVWFYLSRIAMPHEKGHMYSSDGLDTKSDRGPETGFWGVHF
jgi:hypothetical protein